MLLTYFMHAVLPSHKVAHFMTHRKYFDAYLAYFFQRFCANKSVRLIGDFGMKFPLPETRAAKRAKF